MGILPGCKDPALKALKSKGYNVVRLPRVDLVPTQLLAANGKSLQRLGAMTSVFDASPQVALPTISPDQPGPNISGTKSSDIQLGVGLNILGGLISALGGSTLGLSLGYSRARTIQFEYADTLANSVEPALIDQFVAASSINAFARASSELLAADQVYVVTATLKSRKINVTAKDANKKNVGIDLPVIQNAVGANLKVTASGSENSVVTYEAAVPLVFAFQAIRLVFDGGHYRTFRLIDAGSVAAEAVAVGGGEPASEPDPEYLDTELELGG